MIEVPLTWQLAKLGLSIGMVLGLGAVAVRASPRMAGLLAGYPLGTALALFFIGLELSPEFATQSAVHTLAGFTASMALGAGYLVMGRPPGLKGILSGVAGGLIAWFAVSSVLAQFSFTRVSGTLVTLAAIAIFSWLFRKVPDVKSPASRAFSWPALATRAGLATVIIFIITRLAHWLPPEWAGTLAAFPVTMLPFLLILHLNNGHAPVATVIKHYPMGLGSLLSYTLCVSYTYSTMGLFWGTLAGFATATLWLLGWMQLTAWFKRRAT
ncbi:hypothetical protein LOS15_00115 [Halomonas sp. 7T]|uniref:hypothetical protein n=1 Tax=Halomonas sp. 7T TaxID=2893469 RepID=UPI0021D7D716|nr:hypothetical protein [Halomonas sp. 7T]UXZ54482.1 hypothetical protein LOS15_00115 [Halomonas sp. 7T]